MKLLHQTQQRDFLEKKSYNAHYFELNNQTFTLLVVECLNLNNN